MRLNPESVARASSRRPWTVIGAWVLVLVVAGFLSSALLADVLTTDFDFTDNPESKRAEQLLEDRLRGEMPFTELLVVTAESATADDPAFIAYVDDLEAAAIGLGPQLVIAESVVDYRQIPVFVSADGRAVLISVTLANTDLDEASDDAATLGETVHVVPRPEGFGVVLAGQGTSNNDFTALAEETLRKGESFGVIVALIVLIIVIGSVVAAFLPIILAIAAIAISLGVVSLIGQLFDLTFFVTNMITMIGLAVGIDYSLFIVARYREERVRGFDKIEAIGRSGATAGRAVFFSGMTVVLALLGMLFLPNTIFRSLGIGTIVVVVLAMGASMTLLPSLLSLLGDRVNKGRVRRRSSLENVDKIGGVWDKITNGVMRRPVLWLAAGGLFMVLLASSFFSMETGFSGAATLPDYTESRQAVTILEEEGFPFPQPAEIVVDGLITSDVEVAIGKLQAAIAADGGFGATTVEVNPAGDLALVSAPLVEDIQTESSVAAVQRLRDNIVPVAFNGTEVDVLVGGFTAFTIDFFEDVNTFTPIVFIFVLSLSFILLTVVFRSLVVPLKAILLNLLSVGAAYGMLVLFFQEGVGPGWVKSIAESLGFIQVPVIEAWLPLMLFSILFGLSMDYEVFLLTRIREHFDKTGDNARAVAHGLRTTGAIITGAALIMVAVFGGFAAGDLVPLQQMGFGLAVAVFLDATVIRSILVPSTMRLLGNVNWYLPRWLQWLPAIDIEGHEAAAAAQEREDSLVSG
ncbi:MAG: MMPL family transporter [Acidimicrobiia bacterium]